MVQRWFYFIFHFAHLFVIIQPVQWSTRADYSNIVGERELLEWSSFHGTMGAHCSITGLTQGRRYFLRGACGNVKGWGNYRNSVPASVVPSSEYQSYFIFLVSKECTSYTSS